MFSRVYTETRVAMSALAPSGPHKATRASFFDRYMLEPFIPAVLAEKPEMHQRVRLFLLSHLFGPLVGTALVGYLLILQGDLDVRILTIFGAVITFWLYPPAVKYTGRFTLLAFVSLQHLTALVLFASYHYGGFASPFFLWLLVIPLFGFFYLSDRPTMRAWVIGALLLNVLAYLVVTDWLGPEPKLSLPGGDTIYLASLFSAGIYVMFMAMAHNRLFAQQIALQRETEAQRRISEELMRAKDAAENASRAKSEFLATTSHELRTPLNAVIGFSQLLMQQPFGPIGEKYLSYIQNIEHSGSHLLDIINDILDVARAETGRFELTEAEVDVADVVETSLRFLDARARNAGIHLAVDVEPGLPRLWADTRRTKQMLLNLIGNAIKFTAEGGRIRIRACRETDGLSIAVIDTGIGIAAEDLEKVLTPFYQVDNSLSRRNEGVGLGLPLVSKIMQRHGGDIVLTSVLGEGTTATLRFPEARVLRQTDAGHVLPGVPA